MSLQTHSSQSTGAVSSVKLRHFSGKLRHSQIRNTALQDRSKDSHCGKTHSTRCCKQLTRPNMDSGKTQRLKARSINHPSMPQLRDIGAILVKVSLGRVRTSSANATSAASVQLSCFPLSRDIVCPEWRASNAIRL